MVLFLMLAAAVNKTMSVIKSIGKDNNLVATQVIIWILGILALALASQADVMEGLTLPGLNEPLADLNFASICLLGWMLGSTGSFGYDALKSIDNTRSAAEPKLLGPKGARE